MTTSAEWFKEYRARYYAERCAYLKKFMAVNYDDVLAKHQQLHVLSKKIASSQEAEYCAEQYNELLSCIALLNALPVPMQAVTLTDLNIDVTAHSKSLVDRWKFVCNDIDLDCRLTDYPFDDQESLTTFAAYVKFVNESKSHVNN